VSSFNRIVLNVPFDYLSRSPRTTTTTIRLGRARERHVKGLVVRPLFGDPRDGPIVREARNERIHRRRPSKYPSRARNRSAGVHRDVARCRALSRAGLFSSGALRERENPLTPLIRGEGRVYFSRMCRGQWRALPRGINHTAADRGEGRAASEEREQEEMKKKAGEEERRRL